MVRVYCGTYGKYNAGSITGEWVDISDYSDLEELYDYFKELHKDESDPEFMFQDIEFENEVLEGKVSECHIDEDIFEAMEALEDASLDIEVYEAFTAFNDISNYSDIQSFISACEERYRGEYKSDEDFAEEWYEETSVTEIPSGLYIDWKRTARGLMMDFFEHNGYYFHQN